MDQACPERVRTKKRLDPSQRRNVGMSFGVREDEYQAIARIAFERGYRGLGEYLRAVALPPQEQKQDQELEAIR
jgi:hypothetical protein